MAFAYEAACRFSTLDPGGTSGRGYSGWPSPLSGVPLPLPGGKKASESRDLSSGHSHDRTAFEPFAPDMSEQPDPNLTDLFDTRNRGSQRLSASYQHTRHVVVTRTHAHTTRDKGTKALTVVSGEVRAELPRLFLCERPSSIAPRWVKGGRQELEGTQSGKESVQLPAVHHRCGANRGKLSLIHI